MCTSCLNRSILREAPIPVRHMGMHMARIITVTAMTIEKRLAAMVCLTLLTTILPEMLSGNTPAEILFRPDTFIFFALAYALPIIVIREWSMRLGLNGGGIFLAGMGYGLINEGLLAKTIFIEAGGPIDVFDQYGFAFGVNFPWLAVIIAWHGLSSVLLPIVLTHQLVPEAAVGPWLGKKTAWFVAVLAAVLSSLFFLNDESSGAMGSLPMLAALWIAIALFAFAGSRLKGVIGTAGFVTRWKPFLFGLSGLVFFIAILLVAQAGAPIALYFAAFSALAFLWVTLLRRNGWQNNPAFSRVAHGWYAQMAGFGWINVVHRSPLTVVFGAVILLLMHWLLQRTERASAK